MMAETAREKLKILLPTGLSNNREHAEEFGMWAEKAN
jgi:hypothetical protein